MIDWNTHCPWQLYTFAAVHLLVGIAMHLLDACTLVFATPDKCSGSELVMSRMMAICLVYVGVIFGVLTHVGKEAPGKITRLSNFGFVSATALTVGILSLRGKERPWMHCGDLLTGFALMGILGARAMHPDAASC
jgi:hypothetical protein